MVRVRFAPSPTGPLHIGGVRTALYNYLFAKKHGGDFILRIEDTDRARFVPGAEEYILESLKWCGIEPNEGIGAPPLKEPIISKENALSYRQSERKGIYGPFAQQLINNGHAYYAFDTSEELEACRKKDSNFAYNSISRKNLNNSLVLTEAEVNQKISGGEPYVIRMKIPPGEEVKVNDLIRGEVVVNTLQMDDKVLFKSDGMPTYHLANVVDDFLMKITHVIRGEEWLPSAPLHVLLYRFLGWENLMPKFAHLPLLLKPEGNGKLSKRDGDRLGFPVFPLQWTDPDSKEVSSGYRENGYYPDAFINMLALLGWNPGTEQEIFSLEELAMVFSFEHIHKAGAKFNPEKAKWFNQQYLWTKSADDLAKEFLKIEPRINIFELDFIKKVCLLVKEKACFVSDFWELSHYIFIPPTGYDVEIIKKKWNETTNNFFVVLAENLKQPKGFQKNDIDQIIKQTAISQNIKPGEIMQLLRVLLTGKGSGVDLLGLMELLGNFEVCNRLVKGMEFVKEKTYIK